MTHQATDPSEPRALGLLAQERPRDVGWLQAAGLLFGDWGTSRLYVLGLALFFAGRTSFWLICGMSLLIMAVAWAYTEIARIYPDGGGVYSAAKRRSQVLAVIGALLLFADYTVTASLSVLDAFHYFGLPLHHSAQVDAEKFEKAALIGPPRVATEKYDPSPDIDAGNRLNVHRQEPASGKDVFFKIDSPALWAVVAIAGIGLFSFMGPGQTGKFAIGAAIGMVFITLLICAFALPQVQWSQLPQRIGSLHGHPPLAIWISFVSIVLALSGVEAIANLTGVMIKPVTRTSRKAIWTVASEVAVFNILLAICMLALPMINRDAHLEDMAAFLAGHYVGLWGEWAVRIVGGLLLLSAGNTAITDMISIQFLMARDGELPRPLSALNRFGVPWLAACVATSVPILVLLISHDLDRLASLYAIGVAGAVTINVSMCATHPRLRKWYRKLPMALLGALLLTIWITVAIVKHDALIFVSVIMALGLTARYINRWWNRTHPQPTLLQDAINEQLTPEALAKPRIMVATYGSATMCPAAIAEAKKRNALLVVGFVREIVLAYKWNVGLSAERDIAATKTFIRYLELGHAAGVPILPLYDAGPDSALLLAELAASHNCGTILIGKTGRRRGSFLKRLRRHLPAEIKVVVMDAAANSSVIASTSA